MTGYKKFIFYLVLALFISFGVSISQTQTVKEITPSEETEKITPFEKRCSVCHSLERIGSEMEKMIKEMHKKAGIQISDKAIKEIEATFTLNPEAEPHSALFQEKCASCHSLDKVVQAHQTKDESEFKKTIQRMANKEESGISKEEIEKIHMSMNMLNEIYEKDIEVKSEYKK